MDNRTRQPAPDYTSSALFFLFINMLWIFGVIWVSWGLGAVARSSRVMRWFTATLLDRRLNGAA